MEENREKERIVINGMTFKADRLLPNYRGEYGNVCDDCIFNKDWIDFGDCYSPCRLVECIRIARSKGNYNIWSVDGSVTTLKSKEEKRFNEHKDDILHRYLVWRDSPEEIADELYLH